MISACSAPHGEPGTSYILRFQTSRKMFNSITMFFKCNVEHGTNALSISAFLFSDNTNTYLISFLPIGTIKLHVLIWVKIIREKGKAKSPNNPEKYCLGDSAHKSSYFTRFWKASSLPAVTGPFCSLKFWGDSPANGTNGSLNEKAQQNDRCDVRDLPREAAQNVLWTSLSLLICLQGWSTWRTLEFLAH